APQELPVPLQPQVTRRPEQPHDRETTQSRLGQKHRPSEQRQNRRHLRNSSPLPRTQDTPAPPLILSKYIWLISSPPSKPCPKAQRPWSHGRSRSAPDPLPPSSAPRICARPALPSATFISSFRWAGFFWAPPSTTATASPVAGSPPNSPIRTDFSRSAATSMR